MAIYDIGVKEDYSIKKAGRNDPCSCGSGKKYKNCCIKKTSHQKPPEVSLDLWRQLYRVANHYQKLLPWKYLTENHLFAVRDPSSGNINYCTVLGEFGEFLGFVLYRGREGLEFHIRAQDSSIDDSQLLPIYNSLLVEFCNRSALEKESLQIIKALGSEFSEQKLYPHFQSFLPGFIPWFLTSEEVQLLTSTLECAVAHIEHYIKDPIFKKTIDHNSSFLLYSKNPPGKDFETSWHEPPSLPLKDFSKAPLDEQKIQAIKEKIFNRDTTWEISAEYNLATNICEGDRPYFLQTAFIMNEESGLLILFEPIPQNTCPYIALRKFALIAMEKQGQIPNSILVRDENAYNAFLPLEKLLKLEIVISDSLPNIDHAKKYMETEMSKE